MRRLLAVLLVGLPLAAWTVWAAMAIWFDGPASRALAGLLAGVVVIATAALAVVPRPRWRGLAAACVLLVAVTAVWRAIPARNDRDWAPEYAHAPRAYLHGDLLTVQNVRNFAYRSETDFTPHWETRSYDLSKLRGVDLFLSYWGPRAIAHTVMSWDFADGQDLAVSIETRRERGESYSAIAGFFRQYELYYVVADERDLIGLRTNHRGEDVYLYRLRGRPERARELLLVYVDSMNDLADHPRWYNAFSQNCTTSIDLLVQRAFGDRRQNLADWRLYANGYLDELLYERGVIQTAMPFADLRAASAVSARGKAAGDAPDFSERIRAGLPDRPPPPAGS